MSRKNIAPTLSELARFGTDIPDSSRRDLGTVLPVVICDHAYFAATEEALRICRDKVRFGALPVVVRGVETDDGILEVHGEPIVSVVYLYEMPRLELPAEITHIMVIQWDGFIVNPKAWTPEFLDYDYIGAPWPDGVVGNCGFCLMSRKLLESIASLGLKPTAADCAPADVVLCRRLRPQLEAMGCKWAPVELAARFSHEASTWHEEYNGAFGFHGVPLLVDITRKGLNAGATWEGGIPEPPKPLQMPEAAEVAMRCMKERRYPEAESLFRQILDADPNELEVAVAYCEMLTNLDRPQDAIKYLAYAAAKEPYWGGRSIRLANCYNELGDKHRAEFYYKEALRNAPDTPYFHWCYAMWLLGRGRLKEGFEEYQWGYHCRPGRVKRHMSDEWHGESLGPNKTIYVCGEQGMGDAVLFSRFIPALRKVSGARIVLECHAPMVDLFMPGRSPLPTGDQVVRTDEYGSFQTNFDAWISIASLPYALGIETFEEVQKCDPANTWMPKLAAQEWRSKPHKRRIGLVWSGAAINPIDKTRSVSLETFAPLAALEGVQWVNIQFGIPIDTFCGVQMETPDISRTDLLAGVLTSLDEVISVDTFVANLAPSMGIQTRVLVTKRSDWRWTEGETSPWFTSAILYRQERLHEWEGPVMKIKSDLEAILGNTKLDTEGR